jgi:hypothetical protein
MTGDALPAGTRLHSGAILIEELLRRDEKSFVYRAYDVPARRTVTLVEFFPDGASRYEHAVVPPAGWSTPGFVIAQQNFIKSAGAALFAFEQNATIYLAQEYSVATPTDSMQSTHATVPLTPIASSSIASPAPATVIQPPREEIAAAQAPTASIKTRPKFSLADVIPDAIRGAVQGALAGTVGGVLLGAVASLIGDGDFLNGASRGLWALPIGAFAGGLLGALRALPSNAPQLATASARTDEQQLQSTLSGAGKGALLGFFLGGAFLVFAVGSGMEISFFVLLRAILLFALSGAFSGGIVGFIRVAPRDRSRR